MKTSLWVLPLLFMAVSCANGPRFRPMASIPSDKAVVYIYRPKQVVGLGGLYPVNSPWTVCPNGQDCVSLWQGGYCVFTLNPGTNVFTSSLESPSMFLDVIHAHEELCSTNLQPATVYYLKFSMGVSRSKLRPVEPTAALHDLEHYKLETP